MDIVLLLHSFVRLIVLVIAVAGIVFTLDRVVLKAPSGAADRGISSAFVGFYDLQVLLGLLIILLGGLTNVLHPIVMFIGVAVAHGLQGMTRRAEGSRVHMTRLALFIVPLAIILLGLATIGRLPA